MKWRKQPKFKKYKGYSYNSKQDDSKLKMYTKLVTAWVFNLFGMVVFIEKHARYKGVKTSATALLCLILLSTIYQIYLTRESMKDSAFATNMSIIADEKTPDSIYVQSLNHVLLEDDAAGLEIVSRRIPPQAPISIDFVNKGGEYSWFEILESILNVSFSSVNIDGFYVEESVLRFSAEQSELEMRLLDSAMYQSDNGRERANTFKVGVVNSTVGLNEVVGDYYELYEYGIIRNEDDARADSSSFVSLNSSGLTVKSTLKYHTLYDTKNSHFTVSSALSRATMDHNKNQDYTTFSLVDSNVELTVFDMSVPLVLNVRNNSYLNVTNQPVQEYWDDRFTSADTDWIKSRTGLALEGLYLNVASDSKLKLEVKEHTNLHFFNESSFENVEIELMDDKSSSIVFVVALENVTCEEVRKFNKGKIAVVFRDDIQCEVGRGYNLKKYQKDYPFEAFPDLPKDWYKEVMFGK